MWDAREDPHLNLPPQTGEEVGGTPLRGMAGALVGFVRQGGARGGLSDMGRPWGFEPEWVAYFFV